MSDPYFQSLFAERIGGVNYGKGTEIYKFEKIKRAKRKALADFPNRSLVDFGIGENDSMAPESIRQKLTAEANQPANRGYMDNGNQNFKEAVARFMQRNFGVTLNPATQVNHSIGSKPALAMIPVFMLGLCTALVYERTRSLLAPMLTHAVYNACVIGIPTLFV